MVSLIKQQFLLFGIASYIAIALFMAFFYIGTIPPYFIFGVMIVAFIITPIYYDERNNVNHFKISLPISKGTIVKSSYWFSVCIGILLIIYQSILMLFIPHIFDGSHYVYSWQDIVVLINMTLLLSSVILPIYFMFRSFILASFMTLTLSMFAGYLLTDQLIRILNMSEVIVFNDLDPGFPLLVETFIPFQPYIVLSTFSVIIYYISMKGSEKIIAIKDA